MDPLIVAGPVQLDFSLPPLRIWTICVDLSGHQLVARVEGDGCCVCTEKEKTTVSWNSCGQWKPFLVLEGTQGRLTAIGGHVCPIYFRRIDSALWFSNVASRLMLHGEVQELDAFVLLQNLTGIPYPQNNIFEEIQLLEASAEYRLSSAGVERMGSVLSSAGRMPADDVVDLAICEWDEYFSSGADVAVLLSGGYDSRLNLAIACDAARRYGNRVQAFHERKDEYEESIAVAVAEAAGVPLTITGRKTFVGVDHPVMFESAFIDLQSGFYRENLIRWHAYLSYIRHVMPDCIIMGLGAEAHKGKYYRKVRSVARDAGKVFGIDPIMVKAIARKIGLQQVCDDSQVAYFKGLVRYADSFGNSAARVDYVHYQTYIAHGYGHRCHDLQQYFGIPFPLLDNTFLAAVFALSREEKEGFALVTRATKRLMPAVCIIPYTSANEKALEAAEGISATKVMRQFIRLIGPAYYDIFPPRRRGRTRLTRNEVEILQDIVSQSALTRLLLDHARAGIDKVPFMHFDYLVQICLYLNHIEQQHGVVCEFKGGDR